MKYKTDIDIAQNTELIHIKEIAEKLKINEDDLELVDYVIKNTECQLWHCSDLEASGTLCRAVASILLSDKNWCHQIGCQKTMMVSISWDLLLCTPKTVSICSSVYHPIFRVVRI